MNGGFEEALDYLKERTVCVFYKPHETELSTMTFIFYITCVKAWRELKSYDS